MRIRTIKSEGISALSYFVSSRREAMVIDPRRDAAIYKNLADEDDIEITQIKLVSSMVMIVLLIVRPLQLGK